MYRKSKEPRAIGNITEVILTSEKKKITVHKSAYTQIFCSDGRWRGISGEKE